MLTRPPAARLREAQSALEAGRLQDAVELYLSLVADLPDSAPLLATIGQISLQLGKFAEAAAWLARSLQLMPAQPELHAIRSVALARTGDFADALAAVDCALALRKDYPEAHYDRANVLRQLGRLEDALSGYDSAIALRPDYAQAHCSRAAVLQLLQRPHEALAALDEALALEPNFVQAHCNRSVILQELRRLEEALASCDRAVKIKPDHAEAHIARAAILLDLKVLDAALQACDRALQLQPQAPLAHTLRGGVLQELNRLEEALSCYDRALAIDPDSSAAQWSKSTLKLLLGDYEEGWRLYESRWLHHLRGAQRHFQQPLWLGETDLQGKTLLIHPEQGYGDFIQCCRLALLAKQAGATLVLEAPPPLVGLASTIDPSFCVIPSGSPLPPFDVHCPVMSLPLAFGITPASVPAQVPYLHIDPTVRDAWKRHLGPRVRPRIGLAWSGAPGHRNDANRSVRLELLRPLFDLPAEFHALQLMVRTEDEPTLKASPLHLHAERLLDFMDTAALASQLDLIISVDTSAAHLAGALGLPVWILLAFAPDYRWMSQGTRSPWYPTARLFRQPRLGDWPSVVREVSQCLRSEYMTQA